MGGGKRVNGKWCSGGDGDGSGSDGGGERGEELWEVSERVYVGGRVQAHRSFSGTENGSSCAAGGAGAS
ncbi:hypothetical protein M0802_008036 [Mischocyttarus mexicanus]|nr:hypothetical protein M0802_008036 [Mischocyttarus mexicanus]